VVDIIECRFIFWIQFTLDASGIIVVHLFRRIRLWQGCGSLTKQAGCVGSHTVLGVVAMAASLRRDLEVEREDRLAALLVTINIERNVV